MKRTYKLLSLLLAVLLMLPLFASCSAKGSEDNLAPEEEYENYYSQMDNESIKGEIEQNGFTENPFIATGEQNISTFSADVDTASYTYFRKLVGQGYSLSQLQNNAKSFRTEEFINYFKYDVAQPTEGDLFGITADFVTCPWNAKNLLMRLTLQAETAKPTEGNNLVFLIDVSGSMQSDDKLPLLKKAFSHLVGALNENDVVSIVTYSGAEKIVLDGCKGNMDERIMKAINSLKASGSTNGEAGINMAYQIAEKHFIEGGNNRIIMASDGDLNVGISSQEDLTKLIEQKRDAGVYLSVLGFGTGNYRDSKMEALADNGNGVYYYIDGESEAEKVLGTDLLSTLYTVANDVKMQITFDPAFVASYRLIGYENRILNTEDFEDDQKDAGEVGAEHQVTVCYELCLAEGAREAESPWMKLAVRYKNPGETMSLLDEYDLGKEHLRNSASEDIQFLTCVIETVMILHDSKYKNDLTLSDVLEELNALDLTAHPEREEFKNLIQKLSTAK